MRSKLNNKKKFFFLLFIFIHFISLIKSDQAFLARKKLQQVLLINKIIKNHFNILVT